VLWIRIRQDPEHFALADPDLDPPKNFPRPDPDPEYIVPDPEHLRIHDIFVGNRLK
jgi:hypothetical protein